MVSHIASIIIISWMCEPFQIKLIICNNAMCCRINGNYRDNSKSLELWSNEMNIHAAHHQLLLQFRQWSLGFEKSKTFLIFTSKLFALKFLNGIHLNVEIVLGAECKIDYRRFRITIHRGQNPYVSILNEYISSYNCINMI